MCRSVQLEGAGAAHMKATLVNQVRVCVHACMCYNSCTWPMLGRCSPPTRRAAVLLCRLLQQPQAYHRPHVCVCL